MNPEKVLGCLYGQVRGDAFGTRYEFKNSWTVGRQFNQDIINNFLPILGGGPFILDKGQCTDDTELAFGLLQGIIENKGYDKYKIAEKYIKWFKSGPFDIGFNTRHVFATSKNYNDLISKATDDSLSNGCLMRISPLAIYGFFINNNRLLQYCEDDCRMTNPNKQTINAVQVYVIAIKTALSTNNRLRVFDEALKYVKEPLIYKIMMRAKNKEKGFLLSDGNIFKTSDEKYMGYFGVAFQMTFYELLHGKSFYDSMVNVVSQGGDTDTNGCIIGALLGALYNINNIPKQWIRDVTINNKRSGRYPEIDQQHIKELAVKLAVTGYRNQ